MQSITTNADAIFYRKNSVHGYIEAVDAISGEVVAVQNDFNEDFALGKRENLIEVKIADKTILMQKGMVLAEEYLPGTSKYTKPLGDLITNDIMEGEGITKAPLKYGVSYAQMMRWAEKHEEFGKALDLAKRYRADTSHDKLVDMAKDLETKQLNKTQVEAIGKAADILKWSAEKSDPHRFGNAKEKLQTSAVQIVINTGISREPDPTTIEVIDKESME